MAEENINDSQTTQTETTPTEAPTTQGSTTDTSTTQDQTPEGDDDATLLTDAPEAKEPPAKEGEDESGDEDTSSEEPKGELFGVPEGEYEIEGLPEGMEIDKEALEAVTPLAKELGLSNLGMSKLAQVYAEKVMPKVAETVVGNLEKDIVAQRTAWANESQEMLTTDKTFEGMKMDDVQRVAAKSLDRFGGNDFREFLRTTGLGNHPSMVKFAFLTGQAIAEDTTFERGGPAEKTPTRAEKYYGKQG